MTEADNPEPYSLIGGIGPELAIDGRIDLREARRISRVIPHRYKLRIAEAVLSFAELEQIMAAMVGTYLRLSEEENLIYTDLQFKNLVKVVRKLGAEQHGRRTYDKNTSFIFPALKKVAVFRNLLVHGTVFMWDGAHLVAVSQRPRTEIQVAEGVFFTQTKFAWMKETTDHLIKTFRGLAQLYLHPAHQPVHPVHDRSPKGLLQHRDEKRG